MLHHITVNGKPLCDRSNHQMHGEDCGHECRESARQAVRRLRRHFRPDVPVRVVAGDCPRMIEMDRRKMA